MMSNETAIVVVLGYVIVVCLLSHWVSSLTDPKRKR